MNHPFSLKGRVALVTGSTTGLGKSMAVALGKAGARIAARLHSPTDLGKEVAILELEVVVDEESLRGGTV